MKMSSSAEITTSAEAIKAAQEATEKFGATSPEARVAWEFVEEIDASISHEKQMAKVAEEEAAKKAEAEIELEPCAEPVVRNDNSEAVQNALEASKVYGKSSNEARLAWSIVEELDATNAHHRSTDLHASKIEEDEVECSTEEVEPTLSKKPTNVEEAIEQATLASQVYGKHSVDARMAWELVEEMDASASDIRAAKKKAEEAAVEVVEEEPEVVKPVVYKDASEAVAAALAASKEFGTTSIEARMAWELVEEIDSANSHHKTTGSG